MEIVRLEVPRVEATVEDPAKEPRLIKRYANRKLYDTQDSRYVTLQQIAEMVGRGEDVKIIDNKSKEDLTNVTLAQILAQIVHEEEKQGEGSARRSSLRSLIEEGQKRLVDSLPGPLSKLLREDEGKAAAKAAAKPAKTEESDEPKGDKPKGKGPLDDLMHLADDRVKSIVGEVRRLQGRIDELEQRLASMLGRKSKAKGEEE